MLRMVSLSIRSIEGETYLLDPGMAQMYSMNPIETYLLNPGMADAALLLVLVRPVEMLDVGVLLQLLLREELLLAQVARQP
jgi:hypothetical protein